MYLFQTNYGKKIFRHSIKTLEDATSDASIETAFCLTTVQSETVQFVMKWRNYCGINDYFE